MIPLSRHVPQRSKHIKMENRSVVTWVWGKGAVSVNEWEVSFQGDGRILKVSYSEGCTSSNYIKFIDVYTHMNFMTGKLYINKTVF